MKLESSKNTMQVLLGALRNIPHTPVQVGICAALREHFSTTQFYAYIDPLLDDLFRLWPKFSGHVGYPVPGYDGLTARDVFFNTPASKFWDRTTEYGQNRWELVQFCIDTLEQELQ